MSSTTTRTVTRTVALGGIDPDAVVRVELTSLFGMRVAADPQAVGIRATAIRTGSHGLSGIVPAFDGVSIWHVFIAGPADIMRGIRNT